LRRYVSDGAKYTLLAGAGKLIIIHIFLIYIYELGTIFLLVVIAAAGLRGKIRKITHDVVIRLQHLIRCPDSSKFLNSKSMIYLITYDSIDIPLGKAVIEDIIPAIAKLRMDNRITFDSLFTTRLLFSHGILPGLNTSDLMRSDEFFDSLTFK
jgi:hypothetical protein